MAPFIDDLEKALDGYLEPYFPQPRVFRDKKDMNAGDLLDPSIADALCHSVCMVAIYVPRYEDRDYCRQEFFAMQRLERSRMRALGNMLIATHGFIIPLLLRGREEDLPDEIRGRIYADFTKYTTVTGRIAKKPEYAARLDVIANYIHMLHQALKQKQLDACTECAGFSLPPPQQFVHFLPISPVSQLIPR
jgi:hypothetical protein